LAKSPLGGGIPLTLPVTVNLMKFATSIEVKGGDKRISSALRQAWRAQSCSADLEQAQGACDALAQVTKAADGIDPLALLHVQSGLLTTAILLYARATATSGSKSERGSVQLDASKLSPEQQADHDMIVRLRNGAIGHVEQGARIAGDLWHRDFLFAKGSGAGNWEFSSASLSIGFHIEVSETVRRQLPVASAIVKAKCHERLDKAIAVIRDAKLSDQDLLRYKVDPLEWFGSIETALMVFSGGPGTETSAWLPLR